MTQYKLIFLQEPPTELLLILKYFKSGGQFHKLIPRIKKGKN